MGRSRFSCATIALLALALAAWGCGPSGRGAETDPEKGSDAEYLNAALTRELTSLDVYTRGHSLLKGRMAAVGRRFRAHQQEYVDALTKAVRSLGGDADGEGAEVDLSAAKSQADLLTIAYRLESAALDSYIEAAPHLFTAAPRTLFASLAAGHSQHLVVLRQAMGQPLADAAPEAFDGGEVPAPEPPARGVRDDRW